MTCRNGLKARIAEENRSTRPALCQTGGWRLPRARCVPDRQAQRLHGELMQTSRLTTVSDLPPTCNSASAATPTPTAPRSTAALP
eukprot:8777945-Pyramimonas_sp.AAC.1